jgi:hypothetical protein
MFAREPDPIDISLYKAVDVGRSDLFVFLVYTHPEPTQLGRRDLYEILNYLIGKLLSNLNESPKLSIFNFPLSTSITWQATFRRYEKAVF